MNTTVAVLPLLAPSLTDRACFEGSALRELLRQRAPWISWEPLGYPDRPGWQRAHVLTHPDALSIVRALVKECPDLSCITLVDAWSRVVDVAVGART